LGNHQHTVQKACFGDVGDAAVDDDAGVEDLVTPLGLLVSSENSAQSRQIEQIAFVSANDQPDVGHEQHDDDLQKTLSVTWWQAVANYEGEQISAGNSEYAANCGSNESRQADPAQLPLEQDDGEPYHRADSGIQICRQVKRLDQEASDGNN
jgi:hypothetical protein